MAGKPKPSHRLKAKSKKSNKVVELFAFWTDDQGRVSGTFGSSIEKFVFKDETGQEIVIRADDAYFDLYTEPNEHDQQRPAPDEHNQDPGDV